MPNATPIFTLRNRLVADGRWTIVGRLISGILVLCANALMARLLSTGDMGRYFIVTTLIWALSLFGVWGLNHGVVRFIPEHSVKASRNSLAAWLGSALTVAFLCTSLIVALLGTEKIRDFFSFGMNLNLSTSQWRWVTVWFIGTVLQILFCEILRGYKDIKWASLGGGIWAGLILVAGLVAVRALHFDLSFDGALLMSAVALLMGGLLLLVPLRRHVGAVKAPQANLVRAIFRECFPYLAANIAIYLTSQLDLLLVGARLSSEEAGLYGSAARLALILLVPLTVVNAVQAPMISEFFFKGDNDDLERMMRFFAAVAFALTAAGAVVGVVLAPWLLSFIYGPRFEPAAGVFRILSLGFLIHVWAGSPGYALLMTGRQRTMSVICWASAATLFGLGFILVRRHGIEGIALASAAALTLQTLAAWLLTKRNCGIWTHARLTDLSLLFAKPESRPNS